MRAGVVALGCLLRFAGPALAGDPVHAVPPQAPASAPVPISTQPQQKTEVQAKAADAKPHDAGKPARGEESRRDSWRARTCFNAAQTRENVAAHRLAEPFSALRVGGQQGEALRAKLCRWKQDEWIYEVSVLRRDGRIVRLYMNAQNGQSVGALDSNDRH